MNQPVLLLALTLAGAAGFRAEAAPAPGDTNFFPIMAWNWAPTESAVLQKMRDAGLTVAGFVPPSALDACAAAGLNAIVSDPRISGVDWLRVDAAQARSNVQQVVAETAAHPAVLGYSLRDEPHSALFPGLGTMASLIREMAPSKWPYINLFPDYASADQLGTATYAEHLEKFIEVCHPDIISYDNYSLMDDGSLRENYWTNLEAIRHACQKHHLVFWNIVLSVAHFSYREPGAADFRFQAYTTLAYGGRGLSYFTYFAPAVGNYRMAPLDQFGNVTPTWYWMQNVNLQIQKLAPTLLQLRSDQVYHFGKVPAGCQGPPTNSLVTKVHGECVVGEFTHADQSRYVMVVNKDLLKSRHCAVEYRRPPKRVQYVSPYSGGLGAFDGEQVWLAPGQGVLLKPDW